MEVFSVQLALQGNTEPADPVVFQPRDVSGIIAAEFFIIKSGKSRFCGNPTITRQPPTITKTMTAAAALSTKSHTQFGHSKS